MEKPNTIDGLCVMIEQLKINVEWGDVDGALKQVELIKKTLKTGKYPQLQKYGNK